MINLSLDFPTLMIFAVGIFLLGLFVALAFDGRRRKRSREQGETKQVPKVPMDDELRAMVENGGNSRVLMEGGFHLRDALVMPEGMIVRGGLFLHDESVLEAPVEVFGGATLGVRARAGRSLFVHGDLTLGKDSRVPSCHVEGNVYFHPGSKVEGALHCTAIYIIEGPLDGTPSGESVTVDTRVSAGS